MDAPTDPYAAVNSLYGPGATACWLLTLVSCCISWLGIPRKGASDALDSDFVAVLAFPAVSAAHLVYQVHKFRGADGDERAAQRLAAIEAPLCIVEIAALALLLPFACAADSSCTKRAVLLATTWSLCIAAETYMHICIRYPLPATRLGVLFVGLLVWMGAWMGAVTVASFLVLLGAALLEHPSLTSYKQRHHLLFDYLESLLIVLILIVAVVASVRFNHVAISAYLFPSILDRMLFPRTSMSVLDLDQAVALFLGVTVVGFSLYSIRSERRHPEHQRSEGTVTGTAGHRGGV